MDETERDTMRVRLQRTADAARSTAAQAKDTRETRNEVIWEADAAGYTYTEISRWTGYGVSTVRAIILLPH